MKGREDEGHHSEEEKKLILEPKIDVIRPKTAFLANFDKYTKREELHDIKK